MSARLRHRPIYGGVFGRGELVLATLPVIENGLHAVLFMVVDPRDGTVLSSGDSKVEVIASARRILRGGDIELAANDPKWEQAELWPGLPTAPALLARPRLVSRRRREIFDRSQGRCHYCRCRLELGGRWHVDHQLPRALGGSDAPLNLVASCVACNLAKSDRTALEFVTKEKEHGS